MAPIKQKHIRGNQSPYMNKDIHKAIMARTRLKVNECRFKNIPIYSFSYKNNTLKISHS